MQTFCIDVCQRLVILRCWLRIVIKLRLAQSDEMKFSGSCCSGSKQLECALLVSYIMIYFVISRKTVYRKLAKYTQYQNIKILNEIEFVIHIKYWR